MCLMSRQDLPVKMVSVKRTEKSSSWKISMCSMSNCGLLENFKRLLLEKKNRYLRIKVVSVAAFVYIKEGIKKIDTAHLSKNTRLKGFIYEHKMLVCLSVLIKLFLNKTFALDLLKVSQTKHTKIKESFLLNSPLAPLFILLIQ